jgi:hypothetical protein
MSTDPAAGAAEPSTTDRSTSGRSVLGTLALALTVLSIVGFVILAVGSIAEWKGFSDDPNDNSAFADVVWSTFALGGILALIAGIVAWVRGRGRGVRGDVRAGQTAVGWVILAVILSVIISALE